jgi:hypothetical protein
MGHIGPLPVGVGERRVASNGAEQRTTAASGSKYLGLACAFSRLRRSWGVWTLADTEEVNGSIQCRPPGQGACLIDGHALFRACVTNCVTKRGDDLTGFVVLPGVGVVNPTLGWIARHRRCVRDYDACKPPRSHDPPAMILLPANASPNEAARLLDSGTDS